MARLTSCDICGTVEDSSSLPPNVEPVRFQTAVANFELVLCQTCLTTKTIRELIEHANSGPGGTVEGADRVPYLLRG